MVKLEIKRSTLFRIVCTSEDAFSHIKLCDDLFRYRKAVLVITSLVFVVFLNSCNNNSILCEELISTEEIRIVSVDSKSIHIPIEYSPGDRAKFTLSRDESTVLVTNGTESYFTIDLENQKVGLKNVLGISKIRTINLPLYHNDDSIFFVSDYPPTVLRMNLDGVVKEQINLVDAPTNDWLGGSRGTLYGLEEFYEQGRPQLVEKELVILLASEFYYFPQKEKVEFFGAYDLKNKNWNSVFSTASDEYLSDNFETPESHLYPYIAIGHGRILISYPLSHKLQVYKRENGNIVFDSTICAKSIYMGDFSKPPKLGNMDGQIGRDYFVTAPAYGALNYHEKPEIYSRVVRHGLSILDKSTLPNLCDRNYSLQIFDKEFRFIDEVYLDKSTYQWAYPIPTSSGFIMRKRCDPNERESLVVFEELLIERGFNE